MLVALTIDTEHPDRPHCPPGVLEETLELLKNHETSATFFIQGRWASAYPDQAKAIADSHLIGNHSHFHVAMKLLDDRAIRIDIEAAERAIVEATRVSPKPWLRLPFLNGADDARVIGAIESLGYQHVGIHAAPGDWFSDRSADELAEGTIDQLGGKDGIVLLHSWPARVPEALSILIGRLRDVGAEFIQIDDPRAQSLLRTARPSLT